MTAIRKMWVDPEVDIAPNGSGVFYSTKGNEFEIPVLVMTEKALKEILCHLCIRIETEGWEGDTTVDKFMRDIQAELKRKEESEG